MPGSGNLWVAFTNWSRGRPVVQGSLEDWWARWCSSNSLTTYHLPREQDRLSLGNCFGERTQSARWPAEPCHQSGVPWRRADSGVTLRRPLGHSLLLGSEPLGLSILGARGARVKELGVWSWGWGAGGGGGGGAACPVLLRAESSEISGICPCSSEGQWSTHNLVTSVGRLVSGPLQTHPIS